MISRRQAELTQGKTDQSPEVDSFHDSAAIRYLSLATESTLPMNYTFEAPDQCCLALGLAETDGVTEL
jgi:hypothetical protein